MGTQAEGYVKDPKDERERATSREEKEGAVVKVRVHDTPAMVNLGISKLSQYKDEYGKAIKKVETIDERTGKFEVTIDRKAKERKERQDWIDARGYKPEDAKVKIESRDPVGGKPMVTTATVEEASPADLERELPESAPGESGLNFNE
jgi:hypothetical protein